MSRFLVLLLGAFAAAWLAATFAPDGGARADWFNEPRPTMGLACTRDSECTSPLVCRSGRCRSECAENRDCGVGRHCTVNPVGIGRCEVDQPSGPLPPDAAYCVSARDCTSGACGRDNQCRG
ncbi:MAG: hypothetical protein H7124_03750 [Phycisphaerales bacterium]|nr:hypothetical protein [Hyphomonadaceae bacterium]